MILIDGFVSLFLGRQCSHQTTAKRKALVPTTAKERFDANGNYIPLPFIEGYRPRLSDFPSLPGVLVWSGSYGRPDFQSSCSKCGSHFHRKTQVKLVESGFKYGKAWAKVKIKWQCDNGHMHSTCKHEFGPEQQKWSTGYYGD
jgi:hypothetical protein